MSITIPDELAKRVLKALEKSFVQTRNVAASERDMFGASGARARQAKREVDIARNLRDELAALLTPKEAT